MPVRHFNPNNTRSCYRRKKAVKSEAPSHNDNVFYASMPDKYQIKTILNCLIGFLMSSLSVDIVITPMFAAIINVGLGVMDASD